MDRPEIRAAMVRDFLGLMRDGHIPRGAEILAAATPTYVSFVEQSSRLAWLDAAPVVKLADAARDIVGADHWRKVHRAMAEDLVERPLFRAFFSGMRAVFGATPLSYAKLFPRVLEQAHRHYGPIEFSGDEHARSAAIRFARCAPEGLSLGMLDVFAGTMEGLAATSARNAQVTIGYLAGASSASLTLRWDR